MSQIASLTVAKAARPLSCGLAGDVGVVPHQDGRASLIVTAFVLMIIMSGLCGCSIPLDDIDAIRIGAVSPSTLQKMASFNMDRAAPIFLRVFKEESTLEVWKQNRTGKYTLLNTYPICKLSGKLGPKISEGDRQAPEGFYQITPEQMFPLSREYLAFNIGFPNAFDRSLGRSGSFIMVHGGCASIGCYAMTHQQMDEIYRLIDEAFSGGQNAVPFEAFPFRMTADNLARHAPNNPNASFWIMLKAGSDSFLETGKPPTIVVCDHRYVFNPPTANKLDPSAPCPPGFASLSVVEDAQSSKSTVEVAAPSHRPPAEGKETLLRKRFAGPPRVHKAERSRHLAAEQARSARADRRVFPVLTTSVPPPRKSQNFAQP
jgi:murein L,D-transpeptidase YafK